MSIEPIITFKAGICEVEGDAEENPSVPLKVKPRVTPGYLYLYSDDLMHLCWRPRTVPLDQPELDLLMFPMDGTFTPYKPTHAGSSSTSKPTNGRIYVLKFSSSSAKHFFWLQSRSQHPNQDPAWFSSRDLRLGEIVNNLLQGEEVDVRQAIANLPPDNSGGDDDEDETMEDVEGTGDPSDHHRSGSGGGGAGPGATGGDIREEGEGAREGGADGGRAAATDANSIIQNFISSMSGGQGAQSAPQNKLFTTLADLLLPAATVPWIEEASTDTVDQLLQFLPPTLTTMAQEADDGAELNTDHASIEASKQALSLSQKKQILKRVLHSPQFSQSLASLTVAIRDGGLPIISESLGIPVRDGGYMRGGAVPLSGGEAVEVFLNGAKGAVTKKDEKEDRMDTQ